VDSPPLQGRDGGPDGATAPTEPLPSSNSSSSAQEWAAHDPLAGASVVAGDGAGPQEGTRRLTRRRLAVAALLAAVIAVVVIVLASASHGKGGAPASGIPAGDTTATVERRTLTESSTVDGTLGYGTTLELYDRLTGTYTWLPSVGATIARGGTLFRVNNLPVVLMYGSVPAYRTLEKGVSDGPDVVQLNRNLIALGYDPDGAIADVEAFSEATEAAVRRWQKAEGLSQTGKVELGRVVFAPSTRRVTAVKVTLGQDPTAAETEPSDSGSPEAGKEPAGEKAPSHKKEPESHKSTPGKDKPSAAKHPKHNDKPKSGKSNEGKAHDAAGDSPSKGSGEPAKSPGTGEGGAGAGAGEAVLTTTSTQQLVQLKLKPEQQRLAHVGQRAPVLLPGGGTVQGTVVEVGTVASETKSAEAEHGGGSPGESGSETTIPVTLALSHPVPHLDQAPVSVELVKGVRQEVLAVPATALIATAGGHYAVQILDAGRRVQVSVTPGMFANGYVQVEGAGLHEGQTVIESE
jgi:peptidoglycan hydrolase-like protein with peptidoglycan-binding domain